MKSVKTFFGALLLTLIAFCVGPSPGFANAINDDYVFSEETMMNNVLLANAAEVNVLPVGVVPRWENNTIYYNIEIIAELTTEIRVPSGSFIYINNENELNTDERTPVVKHVYIGRSYKPPKLC